MLANISLLSAPITGAIFSNFLRVANKLCTILNRAKLVILCLPQILFVNFVHFPVIIVKLLELALADSQSSVEVVEETIFVA